MTYDQIKELIDAFRTETQADSITPDTLGQLIQKIQIGRASCRERVCLYV